MRSTFLTTFGSSIVLICLGDRGLATIAGIGFSSVDLIRLQTSSSFCFADILLISIFSLCYFILSYNL